MSPLVSPTDVYNCICSYDSGKETHFENSDDIDSIKRIVNFMINNPATRRRIEYHTIAFYSNDYDALFDLGSNLVVGETSVYSVKLYSAPADIEEGEIIMRSPEMEGWKYRVYMNHGSPSTTMMNWLAANRSNLKMGYSLERDIDRTVQRMYVTGGRYFYVKNEHTITLLKLSASDDIKKIDRIKYIPN